LILQIKVALRSERDPAMLIGVLVEGIAQAIQHLVPSNERLEMLAATIAMLHDRYPRDGWPP
jgi:hypothetical protein